MEFIRPEIIKKCKKQTKVWEPMSSWTLPSVSCSNIYIDFGDQTKGSVYCAHDLSSLVSPFACYDKYRYLSITPYLIICPCFCRKWIQSSARKINIAIMQFSLILYCLSKKNLHLRNCRIFYYYQCIRCFPVKIDIHTIYWRQWHSVGRQIESI